MQRKKMLIAVLAIALLVGIVSAALIPWFGQIKTTAEVDQAVLVDGKKCGEPITDTFTAAGGECVCRYHWLTSQTSAPVELSFDTTQVDGIKTYIVEYFDDAGATIPTYETPTTCNVEVNFGGNNYATISAAVDGASDGQVICVGPGTYDSAWEETFPIVIDTPNIVLVSTDGPASTTIDAGGLVDAIDIQADGVTIKGFTITNARFGIYLHHITVKDLTVRNCEITNSVQGIHVDTSIIDDLAIENCEITNNEIHGFRASTDSVVDRMTVTNSKFSGNGQGGIMSYSNLDGLTVSDSTFTNNGFGIMLGAESSTAHHIKNVLVTETIFDDNNANPDYMMGFWVYVYGSSDHTIENIVVHSCSITNHDNYGVGFDDLVGDYTGTFIDANNNWWGTDGIQVSGNVDASYMEKTDKTMGPYEVDRFGILYCFNLLIVSDTYTITTTIEPA